MPLLSSSFAPLILSLFAAFTSPTQRVFAEVTFGWIMASGLRTISNVIRAMGTVRSKSYTTFYRFFSKARWSVDRLGMYVAVLAVEAFCLTELALYIVGDDTIARRRGDHVYGVSMFRDAARSSKKKVRLTWSNNWVVLSLLVNLPHLPRPVCIPVLFRLYLTKKRCQEQGVPFHSRNELMAELIQIFARGFEGRKIYFCGDGAYANEVIASSLPTDVELVSRIQKNATLYALPKKAKRRGRGRPRKKGKKLPKLAELAKSRRAPWEVEEIQQYGELRERKLKAFICLWYKVCKDSPVLVVIVRDPENDDEDQYFFTTDTELAPAAVAQIFAMRWQIELAFWESKTLLGLEDNRCWCECSVKRVAPFAFLVQSMVKIWFYKYGYKSKYLRTNDSEWYKKENPSFADMLNTLRAELFAVIISRTSMSRHAKRKILDLISGMAWGA